MISQEHICAETPMGANLMKGGGATFRVWAPRATSVFLSGVFGETRTLDAQSEDARMVKDGAGYWTGFVPEAAEGDLYRFFVTGPGSSGYKRDPYARGLFPPEAFPDCECLIRSGTAYPWHDREFVPPLYTDMIVYQIHIGTYAVSAPGVASTFLDVIGKIPYMVELGINVLQPLPVDEVETEPSMGYDGADYFSPDFPYVILGNDAALAQHVVVINELLAAKGCDPLRVEDLRSGHAQLQAMVDLLHVYGIAVVFDVVYNHAGGFDVNGEFVDGKVVNQVYDDATLYYFDLLPNKGNNNDSLYFTDQDRGTGGLAFALWNADVRQFLINNALYYVNEFHADGFRYDEISIPLSTNKDSGWEFCRDLTSTLRYVKPQLLQNAEYWPEEFQDYPKTGPEIVLAESGGGAGFDTLQHDGLRGAVRGAVEAAAARASAWVKMSEIAATLYPVGFAHAWQTVPCVENHDLVKAGREPRIARLADPSNSRSWYARSRSRFATGILLTAPGIPQIFMGQEFLEDKPWDTGPVEGNLIWWEGAQGSDGAMVNHLRFTRDLIHLRRSYPELRGDSVRVFHVDDGDRVLAFHRWIEGVGQDVVVVATLADSTWWEYAIGFPGSGQWREIFNSDVYDNWVNPMVAGNGGGVWADGVPMHGMPTSAKVVIPANGFVVFARS